MWFAVNRIAVNTLLLQHDSTSSVISFLQHCVVHCGATDNGIAACRSRGAIGLAGREALKQPTWCRLQPDGFASLAGRVPRDRPENLLFLAKSAAGGGGGGGEGQGTAGRHRQHSSAAAAAAAGVAGGAGPQPAVADSASGPSRQVSSRDQSPGAAGGR